MSFRTFQRLAMVSVLSVGGLGVTGCGDSKSKPGNGSDDAGGGSAGNTNNNGGGEDSGVDGGVPPPAGGMCGATFCPKTQDFGGHCCVEGTNACGTDLTDLAMGAINECLPKDVPGVPSAHCGATLDGFENGGMGGGKMEGIFELAIGNMTLTFPVCCTEAGTCGIDGNKTNDSLNLGTGCLDVKALTPAPDPTKPPAPGTTEPSGLPIIPDVFCDYAGGGAKAACKPIPPFLLGACPAKVEKDCIVSVEQNIHGCGTTVKWDRVSLQGLCIDNVDDKIFGCDTISAGTLGRLPELLCGCGTGVAYGSTPAASGFPCLSNVDAKTCGQVPVDLGADKMPDTADDCIAGIDEFVSGCGDAGAGAIWNRDVTKFCVSNVKATVYGCQNVATQPTCPGASGLCGVPSAACGCGDGRLPTKSPPECIPNILATVCGGKVGCTGNATPADPLDDSCFAGESCVSVTPIGAPDAQGDFCGCKPDFDVDGPGGQIPPFDTCNPTGADIQSANGEFVCATLGQAQRCSCGTLEAQGNCVTGMICKDTNGDKFGDTCM